MDATITLVQDDCRFCDSVSSETDEPNAMQRRGDHGAKPGHDSPATVRYDAAAILNRHPERPKRTEAELVRARVRAKILRRVQELEAELHGELRGELENRGRCSVSPKTTSAAERPSSTTLVRGNTAKHEVIKVATQILGRCLTNQSTDKDHTLELQLVHRMLTKECELLAIQTHMENAQA